MNMDLPENKFFEDFYIWFNQEKKEEYYSTPLYYYKASFNIDYDTHTLKIYWKENEGTDNGLKHPATLYFPFVEKFGTFLVRFLNANLSTYESAYKDFFFAYGFEILRDLEEDYKFTLSNNYGNDETYLKETQKNYNTLKHKIIYVQEEMKNAINYIFNIEEDEKLKDYTSAQRYAVYLIKQMGKLHTFNKNDNVIRDSFSNKYEQFQNTSEHTLLNELKNKSMFISMIDTHKSNDLSSICYVVLEELVKTNNNPIKKCQNCGMYFIPNSRLDEMQAAFLSIKLSCLDRMNEERRKIAKKYLDRIDNPLVILPVVEEFAQPVWHIFAVRCDKRNEFEKYLCDNGIGTNKHYPIPMHLQECYKDLGYQQGDFPIAEEISKTELSLPMFYGMSDEQVEYVITKINEFE